MCGSWQHFPQTINQILNAKTGSAGASGGVSSDLAELAIALGRLAFEFLVADECSRTLMGFEQAREFEFAVSPHHGVGIDGEIDGELAHGRELISSIQRAGGDAAPHLVDQLAVNRDAAVQVDGE